MITSEVSLDKIMACHCTDCKKFTGAAFRAVAVVAADDVKISGTVSKFLKIAESGNGWVQGFWGKFAVEWFGEIADPSWIAEGPADAAMTTFKRPSRFLQLCMLAANLWRGDPQQP